MTKNQPEGGSATREKRTGGFEKNSADDKAGFNHHIMNLVLKLAGKDTVPPDEKIYSEPTGGNKRINSHSGVSLPGVLPSTEIKRKTAGIKRSYSIPEDRPGFFETTWNEYFGLIDFDLFTYSNRDKARKEKPANTPQIMRSLEKAVESDRTESIGSPKTAQIQTTHPTGKSGPYQESYQSANAPVEEAYTESKIKTGYKPKDLPRTQESVVFSAGSRPALDKEHLIEATDLDRSQYSPRSKEPKYSESPNNKMVNEASETAKSQDVLTKKTPRTGRRQLTKEADHQKNYDVDSTYEEPPIWGSPYERAGVTESTGSILPDILQEEEIAAEINSSSTINQNTLFTLSLALQMSVQENNKNFTAKPAKYETVPFIRSNLNEIVGNTLGPEAKRIENHIKNIAEYKPDTSVLLSDLARQTRLELSDLMAQETSRANAVFVKNETIQRLLRIMLIIGTREPMAVLENMLRKGSIADMLELLRYLSYMRYGEFRQEIVSYSNTNFRIGSLLSSVPLTQILGLFMVALSGENTEAA